MKFPFRTAVAGTSYRQDAVARCNAGDQLLIVREVDNPEHANACQVVSADGDKLGYVPAAVADRLAPVLDAGGHRAAEATIAEVVGGGELTLGLRLVVSGPCTDASRATPVADVPADAVAQDRATSDAPPDDAPTTDDDDPFTLGTAAPDADVGGADGAGSGTASDEPAGTGETDGDSAQTEALGTSVPQVDRTGVQVHGPSGRLLGTLVSRDDATVTVVSDLGTVTYPTALVSVADDEGAEAA